jgi:pimeloyl-ACP methyl ester carboxylesterase
VWIRIARHGLSIFFLALLLLYGAGAAVELQIEEQEAARFDPPGEMYDIGGRKLHLYCLGQPGQGQPVVILIAGSGDSFYSWWNLQNQLASSGRVCSYDRSGYGWSEVGPRPPAAAALADELQALLQAAGLQPPYLLVGHSFGGLVARQYALDFPGEVQSLVLVESLNAEAIARLPALLRGPLLLIPAVESSAGAVLETAGVFRLLDRWGSFKISPVLAGLPDEVLPGAQAGYYHPRTLATAAREQAAVAESALAMLHRDLPEDLPIVSLLAAPPNGQEMAPELIQDFTGLSANSRVQLLPKASHYLHLIAPGEVLEAIWGAAAEIPADSQSGSEP